MQKWIEAARLRTLPLAFASILLGTFLAYSFGHFDWFILFGCLLTTLLYQVLSNYANDYGDGVRGTDKNRVGEKRAIASGEISVKQMKRAIALVAVLAFISGTALSIYATRNLDIIYTIAFVVLGIAAIIAALSYTMGKFAYAYYGLGDLFVVLFFGLLGVGGAFFLQASYIEPLIFLPATSLGLLAAAVLNLNNMRDIDTDREAKKNTIVVWMGLNAAKIYHAVLLIVVFDLAFLYNRLQSTSSWSNLYFVVLPFLVYNLIRVHRANRPKDFEPLLKQMAITSLLFALSFGLGQVL